MISAVTASVAPSDSAPESPMKIWAGWTLNHRNPSSAPMISAHSSARFGWAGALSRAIEHVRDEGDGQRPARQPVEAVGDVHAVAAAMIANAANSDVDRGSIETGADERDGDGW